MKNSEIAEHFFFMSELSKTAGELSFKSSSYRNAAMAIREHGEPVAEMANPTTIYGIGKGIAEKIKQLLATGTSEKMEKLKKKTPFHELLLVPGIGPVKAKELDSQKISTIEALKQAVADGKVTDSRIKLGLKTLDATGTDRTPLAEAIKLAKPIIKALRKADPNAKIEACGSMRRKKADVGDIDIVCAATKAGLKKIAKKFKGLLEINLSEGETKISGVIKGMQVQIRLFAPEQFGAALLYFTGSRDFNIRMRQIAMEQGLTLNEYELKRGDEHIAGETEESVFESLGLVFVHHHDRETTSYLKAA